MTVPWQDGRRAWNRLNGWHEWTPDRPSTPPFTTEQAMRALADVRLVKGLIEQAELGAVRGARKSGTSWAEIATMLGISRQAAWEKWHDLDE